MLEQIGFAQPKISQQTSIYFDSTRNRRLITEIWLPQDVKLPVPLIMFSHGTGGNRLANRWFCEGMVKRGFMVAAVDHFGNTYDNPIPEEFVSLWKRPEDISFVLSEIQNSKIFHNVVDTANIFAAGFSLGGYSVIALAGAQIDYQQLNGFFQTPQGRKEIDIPEMPGLFDVLQKENIVAGITSHRHLKDKRIKAVMALAPAGPWYDNLTINAEPVALFAFLLLSVCSPLKWCKER